MPPTTRHAVGLRSIGPDPSLQIVLLIVVSGSAGQNFADGEPVEVDRPQEVVAALKDLIGEPPGGEETFETEDESLSDLLQALRPGATVTLRDRLPILDEAVPVVLDQIADALGPTDVGPDAWGRQLIPSIERVLAGKVMRRWPKATAAAREFFGPGFAQLEREIHVASPRDTAGIAFRTWLTTLRRPRATSRTVLEVELDTQAVTPEIGEYLEARAAAVPTILRTRAAQDDGVTVGEDVFTGELAMLRGAPTDDATGRLLAPFPPVDAAQPLLIVPIEDFVVTFPLGPVLDEAGVERALAYLQQEGMGPDPASRTDNAHLFGHLFALDAIATLPGVTAARSKRGGRSRGPRKKSSGKRRPGSTEMLDLAVDIIGTRPKVRRRFLLAADASFAELHAAIQDAFGWEDYHLWEFRPDRRGVAFAGIPMEDDGWGEPPAPDGSRVRLASRLRKKGDRCVYVYDFGDNWEHQVRVMGLQPRAGRERRRLVSGALACPPEDCGGVWGYERCKAFRRGEAAEDDQDLDGWLGDWDPDDFDLESARERFDA